MIYLDYAANTPVDREVLDTFVEATKKYTANPNSSHYLGKLAKEKIDEASDIIANYFHTNRESVIYTSGATESNNLVIKGVYDARKNYGNKIIISSVEHSSIVAPCHYLMSKGCDITVIPLNENGMIDLEVLKKEIDDNTILVSIATVDSELGTVQPIKEIADIVKKYPHCLFHTDATQAIGKVNIDYNDVDFITFTPHKFYGLNGTGVLINKKDIKITPLIHGGKSTTIYRAGTPVTANVLALSKAFSKAIANQQERYEYIKKLNILLREEFKKEKNIHINSPITSIPNILNISVLNVTIKDVIKKLEEKEIYLSTNRLVL